jgi:hypothetical protein
VVLVRYLESVLKDPKASAAMKQVASGRLTELLLSAEATKARAAVALERAQARQMEAELSQSTPAQPDASDQLDPVSDTVAEGLDKMKEFLVSISKSA